jgi:hypothetical protein
MGRAFSGRVDIVERGLGNFIRSNSARVHGNKDKRTSEGEEEIREQLHDSINQSTQSYRTTRHSNPNTSANAASHDIQSQNTKNNSTMSTADSISTHARDTPPPHSTITSRMYGVVMPRPGQPGALYFDNTNVTEFLGRWNIECEDFGLTDSQKCARIPDYCTPETKDVIELLDGYKNNDWTKLQSELKGLFWQHDKQKDTTASLNKLIHNAQNMDLNLFVLKYASISQVLVDKGALSTLDRVGHLLDGLNDHLHEKVLDYCTRQDWRLSSHDTGTKDPDFDQLKQFIIGKAQLAQKQIVYNKERAIREGLIFPATPAVPPAIAATPAPSPALSPVESKIAELTDQFSRLTLFLQANFSGNPNIANAPGAVASGMPWPRTFRERCRWCDSFDHIRKFCPAFMETLRDGRVQFDDQYRLLNAATGVEIPFN